MDTLPQGRIITVTTTVILPATATIEEISDWVSHEGGNQGGISLKNPLYKHGYEADEIDWDDTGSFRETVVSDVRKDGASIRYRVGRRDHHDRRTSEEISGWVSPEQAKKQALAP